jgi:transglutaminase-like putative cysteine protease
MDLRIRHRTHYSYAQPIKLLPHKLMLRPRDSFDLRLLRTGLTIQPAAALSWMHDAYGNSVAIATFGEPSAELSIESDLTIRRYQPATPQRAAAPWRTGAPVAYSEDERIALAPFMKQATMDADGTLSRFAAAAVTAAAAHGHPLLALSAAIHDALDYRMRFEEGTQEPLDTLRSKSGTCRDYAWLFIEGARHLGYAARFITGYLHNVGMENATELTAEVGFSHAWADVYVPGDGWVEFDPTNLLVADRQLIRVAVTRTPAEASPVSGSFVGPPQMVHPAVSVEISPVAIGEAAFAP